MSAEAIIKPDDISKVQAIFPGKFVLVYVGDHDTQKADMGASVANEKDIKLARILIARITLGDNGRPRGLN